MNSQYCTGNLLVRGGSPREVDGQVCRWLWHLRNQVYSSGVRDEGIPRVCNIFRQEHHIGVFHSYPREY